jgi:hypothetical protein
MLERPQKKSAEQQALEDRVGNWALVIIILLSPIGFHLHYAGYNVVGALAWVFILIVVCGFFKIMLSPISRFMD